MRVACSSLAACRSPRQFYAVTLYYILYVALLYGTGGAPNYCAARAVKRQQGERARVFETAPYGYAARNPSARRRQPCWRGATRYRCYADGDCTLALSETGRTTQQTAHTRVTRISVLRRQAAPGRRRASASASDRAERRLRTYITHASHASGDERRVILSGAAGAAAARTRRAVLQRRRRRAAAVAAATAATAATATAATATAATAVRVGTARR